MQVGCVCVYVCECVSRKLQGHKSEKLYWKPAALTNLTTAADAAFDWAVGWSLWGITMFSLTLTPLLQSHNRKRTDFTCKLTRQAMLSGIRRPQTNKETQRTKRPQKMGTTRTFLVQIRVCCESLPTRTLLAAIAIPWVCGSQGPAPV